VQEPIPEEEGGRSSRRSRRREEVEKKYGSSPSSGKDPPRIHVRWKKRSKVFTKKEEEDAEDEMEGFFELRMEDFRRFFGLGGLEFRVSSFEFRVSEIDYSFVRLEWGV
jgi:hypothetical protein